MLTSIASQAQALATVICLRNDQWGVRFNTKTGHSSKFFEID
jgi:hypothetical protein